MPRISGLLFACMAALAASVATDAGKFNARVKIGDVAPDFKNLPGVDGRTHSLGDFKDKDVVVLAFITNHCPVSAGYEDRMIAFVKKHEADRKFAFIAINVNAIEEDKLPKMTERAKKRGFNFLYLYDESQDIGRKLGASVTPEFFVLNKERKIVYMGAMDNNDDRERATEDYLAAAVQAALKGQAPALAETRPRGCSLLYEKKD